MKKYYYFILPVLMAPQISLAQKPGTDVKSLLGYLKGLFNGTLIPLFTTLGLVYVIIAVVGFIMASDDSARREEKKQQIFWGLIGLFVIMTVWALVNIIGNTFDIFRGDSLSPE